MKELEIQVYGQKELESHIHEPHFSYCVSIGNPRSMFKSYAPDTMVPKLFKPRFRKILRLEFYDVEKKSQLTWRQFPRRIPKKSDVQQAIRFFKETRDEANGYTLHCWQGVSRSPAVALGYLYMITGSEDKAINALREIRPGALPHQGIVNMFDEELGCDLTSVNDVLRQEWIKSMKDELDLTEDNLLEELEAE
jgi:predicted protein tyrosine phosphatase